MQCHLPVMAIGVEHTIACDVDVRKILPALAFVFLLVAAADHMSFTVLRKDDGDRELVHSARENIDPEFRESSVHHSPRSIRTNLAEQIGFYSESRRNCC